MADREQAALLEQGARAWNAWRAERPGVRPDLARAHLVHKRLAGADLEGADLAGADLSGTDLTGADLFKADLRDAGLGGTVLARARLTRANLSGANLRSADLTGADLREAVLKAADLERADLTGARLFGAHRAGWLLEGVVCGHAYLDPRGRLRTPRRGSFEAGEFARRYRQVPGFTLAFPGPFTGLHYARLEQRVAALGARHPGWGLRLARVELGGAEVTVAFEVAAEADVAKARTALAGEGVKALEAEG